MIIKRWIDYLFWKRTWFRLGFVLIPIWIIPVAYFNICRNRNALILIYFLTFLLGMVDNHDVDNPQKPFSKI